MHAVKPEQPDSKLDRQRAQLQSDLMPLFELIDKGYIVPEEKMQRLLDYTLNFYAKNRTMKFARIARKVAEHFNLQLKGQQELSSLKPDKHEQNPTEILPRI